MADIVSEKVRSRMMAGIGQKNTKNELVIRSELHRRGYRFRLHAKELPGKPDIVLSKWRTVVFVHGCFWHGHNCYLFRIPSTRTVWWTEKIDRNRSRDASVINELIGLKWKVAVVWECALRRGRSDQVQMVISAIEDFFRTEEDFISIP